MPLSPNVLKEILAPQTALRDIGLITLTHPDWTEDVRLSTDATQWLYNDEDTEEPIYGTKSRGNTFLYIPMQATMPTSEEESPPSGRVTFSNVARIVTPYLMLVGSEYPRVTIEVVTSDTPDIVEKVFPELDLASANWDVSTAEVQFGMDTAANVSIPWLRFIPAYFPNIFDASASGED